MKNYKSNVFIGWSDDNSLALDVEKALKKANYYGITGGNSSHIDSVSIADTVLNQIKKCSGAIMLFTEKTLTEDNGEVIKNLSGNMLFEFGYALSKLDYQRVLIVYIDVRDELIPTDMRGMWDKRLSAHGKTQEELAKEIVDIFIREHKIFDFGDKLRLMSQPERLHNLIRQHMENPAYDNDEIAQIIIIFSQAAYIFDDFINARNLMNEFASKAKSCIEYNYNLKCAHRLAMKYFDLSLSFTDPDDGEKKLHLSKSGYHDFIDSLTVMADDIEENIVSDGMPHENEFEYMFLAVAYEYIVFANMIYYGQRADAELDNSIIEYRIDCCKKCIKYCEMLSKEDEWNESFSKLFEGYVYRNLALFHKQYDTGNVDECFEKSIALRKDINHEFGQDSTVNKHFSSHIEMEYYLSLSDNLYLKDKDKDEKNRRKAKLMSYLDRMQQKKYDKFYHIDTIKDRIDKYCK